MVKGMPVALQLYSVRDALESDFEGTLRQVKDMGYEGVEFAGLYGRTPEAVRKLLEEIGLEAVSAHVPLDEMLADIPGVLSAYRSIGCRYVAVPWLDEERRPGYPGYARCLDGIRAIGEEAKRQGMTLLYHNHDFEFVLVDGVYALDRMYASIPADLLQTELDTCWVAVAGEDPCAYLEKYAGRAPVVHLKDYYMPGRKPKHMYELIGVEAEEAGGEDAVFEFRPVGYGMQDFPAILSSSQKAGARWVVVEQDNPSMGRSPLECARMSIEYLNTLK